MQQPTCGAVHNAAYTVNYKLLSTEIIIYAVPLPQVRARARVCKSD